MLDSGLKKFLDAKIEEKVKKVKTEAEKESVLRQMSLKVWIPNALKRVTQLRLVTHNGKFTHTGTKKEVGLLVPEKKRENDGYVKTGNYHVSQLKTLNNLDCVGNAAALDVYGFLSIELSDGRSVLEHFETKSDYLKRELDDVEITFDDLQEGFLKIIHPENPPASSDLLKQIYFPVEGAYHLLSVLSPSVGMFELKKRIRDILYSEETKTARKARNEQMEGNRFLELYGLTEMGYGGANSQNAGVLNNKNVGKSYLLASVPPSFLSRELRVPRYDFFREVIYYKNFSAQFMALHKLFVVDYNNINIRSARDKLIHSIVDDVVYQAQRIRAYSEGWSFEEKYTKLPMHQKLWLDEKRLEDKNKLELWLPMLLDDFIRWLVWAYEKTMGKDSVQLDDTVYLFLRKMLVENKEAFL